MTQDTRGLTVAAHLAARRTARMPCIDDDCSGNDRELLEHEPSTRLVRERIACSCGRTWRRIWVDGYGS